MLDKSVMQIAKLIIPAMKQRKQPSAIVNIGSAAATVSPSGPLYAVYAGSKVGDYPLDFYAHSYRHCATISHSIARASISKVAHAEQCL